MEITASSFKLRANAPEGRKAISYQKMSNTTTITSACTSEFFHFMQGMVLSVREKPEGSGIDISVLDLGMTPEQLEWMNDQSVNVAKPEWEFGLDESCGFPIPFKGIMARTHIRKYFPGYEIYFHIDADAWVQDWSAVELYIAGARRGVMAVTPEIDRAFISNYRNAKPYREFVTHIYTDLQGPEYAAKYRDYPILNTGVFAMPADSVLWERWAERIGNALRNKPNFHVEQCSINLEIFENLETYLADGLEFLPSSCNWVCHQSLPMFDAERQCLVEPFLPHAKLGIIHRASDDFKQHKTGSIRVVQGGERKMNLKYLEGDFHASLATAEPEKLKRWQDAGFQWSA